MKFVVLLFVVGVCGVVYARPDEKYTTKYDNIDLDEILKNDRLLKNYVDCLLDKKNCSKDGEELKKVLPEALSNECAKCSQNQRNGATKVINYLIDNKRSWWNDLEAKYDPKSTYRVRYQSLAKKEGIAL